MLCRYDRFPMPVTAQMSTIPWNLACMNSTFKVQSLQWYIYSERRDLVKLVSWWACPQKKELKWTEATLQVHHYKKKTIDQRNWHGPDVSDVLFTEGEHAREEPQTNWFSDYAISHLPSSKYSSKTENFQNKIKSNPFTTAIHHKRYEHQKRRSVAVKYCIPYSYMKPMWFR